MTASPIPAQDEFDDANPAQLTFLPKLTRSRLPFLSVDVPLELNWFMSFKDEEIAPTNRSKFSINDFA